jgi:hypothetical protein
MRIFIIVLFTKYNWNYQAKEEGIGRTYSSHEEGGKCLQDFCEKARVKDAIRKTTSRRTAENYNNARYYRNRVGWSGLN